jgi:hypothetical protein
LESASPLAIGVGRISTDVLGKPFEGAFEVEGVNRQNEPF